MIVFTTICGEKYEENINLQDYSFYSFYNYLLELFLYKYNISNKIEYIYDEEIININNFDKLKLINTDIPIFITIIFQEKIKIYSLENEFIVVNNGIITICRDIRNIDYNIFISEYLDKTQLLDIKKIYTTFAGYAVLTNNNDIIIIDNPIYEHDIDFIKVEQEQLINIKEVYSSNGVLAALTNDGNVIIWGDSTKGANNNTYLKDIKYLLSTLDGFAAVTINNDVITWGCVECSSDYDEYYLYGELRRYGFKSDPYYIDYNKYLKNIKKIYSNDYAFVVINNDNDIISWGHSEYGGFLPHNVKNKLKQNIIKDIYSTSKAFAAVTINGEVITWGDNNFGGDSDLVQDQLCKWQLCKEHVIKIYSNKFAFVAITNNGNIITWGDPRFGGNLSKVKHQLHKLQQCKINITNIYSTLYAFAALTEDGNIITWGDRYNGGYYSNKVKLQLQNIQKIYSNNYAFAALTKNGNVITWGNPDYGGDSSRIQNKLINIQNIYSNHNSFVAINICNEIISWGNITSTHNLE